MSAQIFDMHFVENSFFPSFILQRFPCPRRYFVDLLLILVDNLAWWQQANVICFYRLVTQMPLLQKYVPEKQIPLNRKWTGN